MRRLLLLALTTIGMACSGGSSTGSTDGAASSSSGSSGGATDASGSAAVPRAILASEIVPGTHGTACSEVGTWLAVGSFEPVKPIDSGEAIDGGRLTLSCSVAPGDGGFHVVASATVGTATQVSLAGQVATSGTSRMHMQFAKSGKPTYDGPDCSVQLARPDGVALGRVWVEFACESVTAKDAGKTCTARGTFRFENCTQQ